jgi:AraC-like DNA-binding protein
MTFAPTSATVVRGRYTWGDFVPHPAISEWVSSYWHLSTHGPAVVRTLPDACIDVTLRLDGEPGAFVAGPQRLPREWASSEPRVLVGARLMPGAASHLGIDIAKVEDGWTPLQTFLPAAAVRRLVRDVAHAKTIETRIAGLDAFLTERLRNREGDPRLSRSMREAFSSAGQTTVTALARAAGAHPRTLTRLFEKEIGLGPKRFIRVVRFQAALRALPNCKNLTQVAADMGYFDQAHFIRDVRELFGETPTAIMNRTRTA